MSDCSESTSSDVVSVSGISGCIKSSAFRYTRGLEPATLSVVYTSSSESFSAGGTVNYSGKVSCSNMYVTSVQRIGTDGSDYVYSLTAVSRAAFLKSCKIHFMFNGYPETSSGGSQSSGLLAAIKASCGIEPQGVDIDQNAAFVSLDCSCYDALMWLFYHKGLYPSVSLDGKTINFLSFSANGGGSGTLVDTSTSPANSDVIAVQGTLNRKPVDVSQTSDWGTNFDYKNFKTYLSTDQWTIDPIIKVHSTTEIPATTESAAKKVVKAICVLYSSIVQEMCACRFNATTTVTVGTTSTSSSGGSNSISVNSGDVEVKAITDESNFSSIVDECKKAFNEGTNTKNVYIIPFQVTNGYSAADRFTMQIVAVVKASIEMPSDADFEDFNPSGVGLHVASNILAKLLFTWSMDGYSVKFPYTTSTSGTFIENNICSTVADAIKFGETYQAMLRSTTINGYSGAGASLADAYYETFDGTNISSIAYFRS